MTIEELQRHVRGLNDARGWHDTTAEERAMWLVTEVGELLREVLRLPEAAGEAELAGVRHNLGMEMYDVVWNLCDLANIAGVDLEEAFAEKVAINRGREW
jgi:NTP pyrophosphatase (non-canonical NTP hydrolase)